MKKIPRLSLQLNKEVINQLDRNEAGNIMGGEVITTIIGSNCYNTDPNRHNCCTGVETVSGACTSTGTVQQTELPGSCCCGTSTCP